MRRATKKKFEAAELWPIPLTHALLDAVWHPDMRELVLPLRPQPSAWAEWVRVVHPKDGSALFQHAYAGPVEVARSGVVVDRIYWVQEPWQLQGRDVHYRPTAGSGDSDAVGDGYYHPQRDMPKEAARLLLHVTAIACEPVRQLGLRDGCHFGLPTKAGKSQATALRKLWRSLGGWNGEDLDWDDNPWVWVFAVRRLVRESVKL